MGILDNWFSSINGASRGKPIELAFQHKFNEFAKQKAEAFLTRLFTDAVVNAEISDSSERVIDGYSDVLFSDYTGSVGGLGLIDALAKLFISGKSQTHLVYFQKMKLLRELSADEVSEISKITKPEGIQTIVDLRTKKIQKLTGIPDAIYSCLDISGNAQVALLMPLFLLLQDAFILTHNDMQVAKAFLVKINGLRSGVGTYNEEGVRAQAHEIVAGITSGTGALVDAADVIENFKPDIGRITLAKAAISQEVASLFSLSQSYVDGVLTAGVFSEGVGDRLLNDSGLMNTFYRFLKPALKSVLGVDARYVRILDASIETFKSVSMLFNADALLPSAQKTAVLQNLLSKTFPLEVKN